MSDNAQITSVPFDKGFTLHVATREVVVEVVARGKDNHPINDLNASDFAIYEGRQKGSTELRQVSGFRVVDPALPAESTLARESAIILPLGGRCEIRTTVHYELAFHPQNWASGMHTIRVTTRQKHVTLSYRTQFYVGISDMAQLPPLQSSDKIAPELRAAACYHSDVPASILLNVSKADGSKSTALQYDLTISPDSLALAGIEDRSSQIQLQYGICTFSRSGRALGLWQLPLNRSLNTAELKSILDAGLRERIEIPHHGNPALARLVVLEPKSGNLGTVDIEIPRHRATKETKTLDTLEPDRKLLPKEDEQVRVGGRFSLGSVVPAADALCGDVYELPPTTTFLPSDFRSLNSVGSVFTDFLNVSEQTLQQGIPGSTSRTEWFGVDYYGQFWIDKPGKYQFSLNADDGADLYIDDHKVIGNDGIHPPQTIEGSINLTAGRHTMHLPYFEGPKYVGLILQVKPPNGTLDIFDMRDYAIPAQQIANTK